MQRLLPLGRATLASLAILAPGAAVAADLALVIGNHDYRQAPDALSAEADARAVTETLEQRGYDVTSGTDLDRGEMRRHIAAFAEQLDGGEADRVVVFYSGHALRSDGVTYLAPVDQGNGSVVEAMMDGVPLDLVLRLAGQAPVAAVVFIDAAQLDSFEVEAFAAPGLADIAVPEGVLVVSAAAPGRAIPRSTARQSAFGRQVVDDFLAPGVSVGTAVNRLRSPAWASGDTDTSLALVQTPTDSVASRVRPETRAETQAPDTAAPEPEAAAEQRLGLTRAERRKVQVDLTALGYDTRGVEGIFGPGTRAAVERWQQANDLPPTGYLTRAQVALLDRQAPAPLEPEPETAEAAPSAAAQREAALDLSSADRLSIEQRLTELGFGPGRQDGAFDSDTQQAIEGYQRSREQAATGYLDRPTVTAMMQETRGVSQDIVEGAEVLRGILRALDQ
ncbi:peptidoglycan-binding protein [Roseovarius sp. E0-M6]|uniref:peptidoglycan-binding protein n=1 Tax=Roseovarius sp. E0-M6 TaxID=3127118 RepID=UPI0030102E12